MSRHDFENEGVRLTIGWDAPLATFFLQVWTGEETDKEEGPAVWLRTAYAEAPLPDPLLVVARRHIPALPDTLTRQLFVDQLMAPALPPRTFR